ncbi:MAG TPA: Wzz/FepE/Etk N-terminal domain-containing protein [Solirubrobacteraceae bacterium]|jgi:Mrp family chromosome partitioning ATPase|nr:Wzz/FepE/Etk N-terminal domain-containing protein [Solirubrobacteraceae bacterium]
MPRASDNTRASDWLAPQGPREGLGHYVEVIRDRRRLIIACVVIVTLVAAAYAKLASPSYKAESHLLVTPVNGETSLIGLGLITNSGNPTGDVSTAASLVTTSEVAALVAAKIGQTTGRAVLGQVSAVPVAQSNVVAIQATASTAARAQGIANAFALATVQNRTKLLHRQLETIIPTLKQQVEALPVIQRTGQGSLGERLSSLQTLLAGPDPTISVESLAQRPDAPSWPRAKLSIIAGFLIGLVIGLGGAFALESLDPRVRREETLRRIFRLPVLARIPRERRPASRKLPMRPGELSPAAQESYRMLRVALGARTHAEGTRSMMITGSTRSEGKSTVALNLAATLAFSGNKVILVEADLRRPSLAGALDLLTARGKRGTAGVLMGEIALRDALVPVKRLSDNLSALLVEQSAPYLADGLLAASNEVVEQAQSLADYVIFDAPPVTEVSDALPLSQHVDDVLVVARLGHSRTDQLVNLGEVLSRQGVRPTGLVIVSDDYSQGSGYYAPTPTSSNRLGGRVREQIPAIGA